MKYVRIDVTAPGGGMKKAFVVAFPEDMVHAVVAAALKAVAAIQWPGAQVNVHSAGSIDLYATSTHGVSTSLDLKADPEDARLLNVSDYGGHIL